MNEQEKNQSVKALSMNENSEIDDWITYESYLPIPALFTIRNPRALNRSPNMAYSAKSTSVSF